MLVAMDLRGDLDGFVEELFVLLGGAGEEEGVGDGGLAVLDGGDDVAAADPVGFGEVGLRPPRGVVGVGVVEADDVQRKAAGLALDADQLLGRNVVAVVRAVGARVAGADDLADAISLGRRVAEEDAAALVGVGLLAVRAEGGVVGVCDMEHSGQLFFLNASKCAFRYLRHEVQNVSGRVGLYES
jgi:hypothetical protein